MALALHTMFEWFGPVGALKDKIIKYFLNQYLQKYVEEVQTDMFAVDLGKGEAELHGIEIRGDALDALHLPIAVRRGILGHLQLNIPWCVTLVRQASHPPARHPSGSTLPRPPSTICSCRAPSLIPICPHISQHCSTIWFNPSLLSVIFLSVIITFFLLVVITIFSLFYYYDSFFYMIFIMNFHYDFHQ